MKSDKVQGYLMPVFLTLVVISFFLLSLLDVFIGSKIFALFM